MTMYKVIGYELVEERLVIETDYSPMPFFVYPVDKFKNFKALEREINKKIKEIEKRDKKKKDKKEKILKELDEYLNPEPLVI